MLNETQAKQDGGGGAGLHQRRNCYGNMVAINKSNYKNNIYELKDVIFTQGRTSGATK